MTNLKYSAYSKGILLIVAGFIIAFFPGVISGLARLIGGIIIVFCIISLILKIVIFKRSDFGVNIVGAIIGMLVTALPSIISISVPVIAGILLVSAGVERGYNAFLRHGSGEKWGVTAITSAVLIALAVLMFIHPFQVTNAIKVIIGFVMVAVGAFYIVIDRQVISNKQPDVIDVDNFTVK